jgi:hypothetical protein
MFQTVSRENPDGTKTSRLGSCWCKSGTGPFKLACPPSSPTARDTDRSGLQAFVKREFEPYNGGSSGIAEDDSTIAHRGVGGVPTSAPRARRGLGPAQPSARRRPKASFLPVSPWPAVSPWVRVLPVRRHRLPGLPDDDRQMVEILAAMLADGLAMAEAPASPASPQLSPGR